MQLTPKPAKQNRKNRPSLYQLAEEKALGGPSFYYDQLAEMPRPVPGVGTRVKQDAVWTGLIPFVVVFFIPLAMMHVISDC